MAESLIQYDNAAVHDGQTYNALVCGRPAPGDDEMWEGWIEFAPVGGGEVLRTPRETKQPNLPDLEYWAGGLTGTYLEGALRRALDPETPDLRPPTTDARPTYDGPAGAHAHSGPARSAHAGKAGAVLDPFQVYHQGEDILAEELSALDEGHLRNIVRAYDLADEADLDLNSMHRVGLAEMIVAEVRKRES